MRDIKQILIKIEPYNDNKSIMNYISGFNFIINYISNNHIFRAIWKRKGTNEIMQKRSDALVEVWAGKVSKKYKFSDERCDLMWEFKR